MPGDIFTIDVELATGSTDVNAVTANLSFDTSKLTIVDFDNDPDDSFDLSLTDGDDFENSGGPNDTGEIQYSAARGDSDSGTYTLYAVTFEALAETDSAGTMLEFGENTAAANIGQPVSADATDGTVIIEEPNAAPVANNQSVSTDEDTPTNITLMASDADSDPLTYTVVDEPDSGALSGTAPNLTYTPDDNFSGADSFTFQANDGEENSNVATVSITVDAVNDAPTADDQSVSTDEDTPVNITLTANDVDDSSLTYTVVDGPDSGALSGTAPKPDLHPERRI